jgi:DNA (cytosine-5)-methyltransferase 1
VATHANRLAPQEKDKETKMSDTYGLTSFEPLASYDHDSHCWKMFAVISLWGLIESLETLPKSGMTRSGRLFQQPVLAPLIDATESSVWPTPTAHPDNSNVNGKFKNPTLGDAVRMWPTPTAVTRPMEGNVRMYRAKVQAGEMTEAEAEAILGKSVWEAQGKLPMMWPTPTARDHKGAAGFKDENRNLADLTYLAQIQDGYRKYPTMSASGMGNTGSRQILQRRVESGDMTETELKAMSAGNGGRLNPTWVEWLMGFPLGWTDLGASETPSSPRSPSSSDAA